MPPKPKPPAPPSTTQQLAEILTTTAKAIEDITSENPELRETIQKLISTFLTNPTIAKLHRAPQAPTPSESPLPKLLEDVKSIKSSLVALQKAISPSTQSGKPSPSKTPVHAPAAPITRAKGKTPSPSFASAAASPPRPSLVVCLDFLNWNKGRPSPATLCSDINRVLETLGNDQVRISAVKWTARDNLILTGGPNTTAHHLQQAAPLISQHFGDTYPLYPPTIRPNVKWSKLLINNVPTGVTAEDKAKTPDECHAALVSDNPTYASLNITQKPSWVRNPSSYPEGAISLLVVAFEDPDGSLAREILTKKVLYMYGHCATIRKWKQQPTTKTPQSDHANITDTPDTSNELNIDKLILKSADDSTRTPCSEGTETTKNTRAQIADRRLEGGKERKEQHKPRADGAHRDLTYPTTRHICHCNFKPNAWHCMMPTIRVRGDCFC
ncbi:hypothetical protein EI94DRAFT_1707072 [Lactarius quietus]|nr:hypothetical protein EI94DRAFT_1707072 [Lactarius quietus]